MIINNCNPSKSNKVGFLSKLSCGYCLENKIGGQKFPWFGFTSNLENFVFALDNDDTLVLDNDDTFVVRAEA